MGLLKELLKPLAEDGTAMTREQAADVLTEILAGGVPDVEVAALVSVLATRGEQAPELAGFVDVMRQRATPVPLDPEERDQLVDIVGTGGGGPLTFNISSGAALVAAAAGAKVAKHGNRAITSRCGAADVLEAPGRADRSHAGAGGGVTARDGVHVSLCAALSPGHEGSGTAAQDVGIPDHLQPLRATDQPGRGAEIEVIGVLAPSRVLLVGRTLAALGARRAFVVHGTDGIDELTTTGESSVARIIETDGGPPTLNAARVTPEMAGLPRATLDQFTGGDVDTNAAHLYVVITGIPGARRDIVVLNAAAALVAAGLAFDLKEGVTRAAEAIDSGEAAATLAKLRQFGQRHTTVQ